MRSSPLVFNVVKIAAPLAAIVWCLLYLTDSTGSYNEVLRQFRDEKKLFVSDFLEHEIDGRFDGSGIAELCQSRKWTKGLVLSCESPVGGVANVKNAQLNCIRIAIEMGAELILPGIIQRREQNIASLAPNAKAPQRGNPLDYFFDVEHLNSTLRAYCPQMRIHRSIDDLWEVPSLLQSIPLSLAQAGIDAPGGIISSPATFAKDLATYVALKSPPDKRKHPVHFRLSMTMFVWPTSSDPPSFSLHFGRILRVRTDARRLAAAALFNMQKRFRLHLDPRKQPGSTAESSRTFVGVHLRTEVDVANRFPDYETQAAYYLDYVVKSQAPVAFLATGAAADNVTAFAARARDFNVTTVVKTDLLLDGLPGEKAALEALSYDQRALVDYEIMLRAGWLTGTSASPFAWSLAMRRHNAFGSTRAALNTNATRPKKIIGNVAWKDDFSTVYGNDNNFPTMQKTIWP